MQEPARARSQLQRAIITIYVRNPRRFANTIAFLLCLLFLVTGVLWISRAGIQYDEVLFGGGVYPPFVRGDSIRIFGLELPLMVMSYVGTLKSMLFRFVIFPVWEPSAASIRVPMVCLGALSIWVFYRLVLRVEGTAAALIGTALLATDTIYLLTSRWDWGPVVLQHLCSLAGLLFLVRFWSGRKDWDLAAGSFLFGLLLWDKALAIWLMSGLAIAAILLARPVVRGLLRRRFLMIALLSFLTGTLPLVIYNVRHDLMTFRGNTKWSLAEIGTKGHHLMIALNGSGMFGYVTRVEGDGPVRVPATEGERLLVRINRSLGSPEEQWLPALLLASLALLPFVRSAHRAVAFALITGCIAWLLMAGTEGAGASIHHTVLLWPIPQFVIGSVLGTLTGRYRAARAPIIIAVAAVCGSNLVVTSTYYHDLLLNGSSVIWTDAINPALTSLRALQPKRVCVLEWGFYEQLRTLTQGRMELCTASAPTAEGETQGAINTLRQSGTLFITHTSGTEIEKGRTERFVSFAKRNGFVATNQQVHRDGNGRDVILTFQLTPAQVLPSDSRKTF